MIEAAINTAALAIVAIACVIHMKPIVRAPDCYTIGFAMVLAGAIGSAVEWWIPEIQRVTGLALESEDSFRVDTILDVGLALVALSMTRAHMRPLWPFAAKAPAAGPSIVTLQRYVSAPSWRVRARARISNTRKSWCAPCSRTTDSRG